MARPSLRDLLLTLALAIVSYVATHLLPIPGGLREVMAATGSPLLDQIPSFSAEETYARIAAFGVQGRELYRDFTLITDVIFPLTWMPFLFVFARFAYSRFGAPPIVRLLMLAFPVVYFGADMVENVFVWVMLTDFPAQHPLLGAAIAYPTVAKWLGLILAVLVPSVMIIAWQAKRLFVRSNNG